ncbi:GIY-YIG nuclease family protein [Sphingomonas sp. AR_OL41]|uniref:GIY-YIG nuclease family protein n=1 Tax=Sphingomonas sp. AR_OL41 TaxID=3042729 RepID=UPI0024814A49|nr:GIY-YIG nuclease family protein [Sphingomonas sp. AR_OL41]MDH7973537.1 GIY-YIG nuclease family protein [Sphingomonas sp. AR_OL41]
MQVTSYGLFWREDEIDWHPGGGNRDSFRLLGRIGAQRGKLRVADFRQQQGIYILYDEYGPSYVGLTRNQGLGKRLKDHKTDHLAGKWDRFSWFGFRPLVASGPSGLTELGSPQTDVSEDTNTTIGDLEALLIRAIGPKRNRQHMSFDCADRWTQIAYDDFDKYLKRVKPSAQKSPTELA